MPIRSPFDRLFADPDAIEVELRDAEQDRAGAPEETAGEPPTYRCRVCGLEAPEKDYCPECLADTMVLVKRP
jgi:hypothetical protein